MAGEAQRTTVSETPLPNVRAVSLFFINANLDQRFANSAGSK